MAKKLIVGGLMLAVACILLVSGGGESFAQNTSVSAKAPVDSSAETVNRFIRAFHNQDYKQALDLRFEVRLAIASIQQKNPKLLWEKLTKEYYDHKFSVIACQIKRNEDGYALLNKGQKAYWTVCPMEYELEPLISLVPRSSEWKIVETRPAKREMDLSAEFAGQEYERTIVFVSVRYVSFADAPVDGDRRLRETAIEFRLRNGLIDGINRIPAADVWFSNSTSAVTSTPNQSPTPNVSRTAPSPPTPARAAQLVTKMNVYNRTFSTLQVWLDEAAQPVELRPGRSLERELEVGSRHRIRVTSRIGSMDRTFDVPRVMRRIDISENDLR